MDQRKKLILIIGPHRSGTSLCAAAIECMGADLRLRDQYSNEENSKGFFEQADVVEFNDRLLQFLGGSWDNPLFDGRAAIAGAELAEWEAQACTLVESVFSGAQTVAIKDPRFCQLLDFWLPVFEKNGYAEDDIFLVQVVRDPVEVALSQQSRARANPVFYDIGQHLPEGACLWLSLTAQALLQGRDRSAYFIHYDELLRRPAEVLNALAHYLELQPEQKVLQKFCEDFVDTGLHHSRAESAASQQISAGFPALFEFYRSLQTITPNRKASVPAIDEVLAVYTDSAVQQTMQDIMAPALSRLSASTRSDRLELERVQAVVADLNKQVQQLADNTSRIIAEHESVVTPLREQLHSLESVTQQLQQQRDDQKTELDRLSRELTLVSDSKIQLEAEHAYLVEKHSAMEASTSWRLTRPLRAIKSFQLAAREQISSSLATFKLRSVIAYHQLSVTHPRVAWLGRRALRPVFRLLGKMQSSPSGRLVPQSPGDLLSPMLYQQIESGDDFAPLVSIIVPNFNHAAYLRLRLDSIFSQSYPNFEVIMLDDASADESVAILAEYHRNNPHNSTLIANEQNSGGVFHQWERGFQQAQGDIVWIAESDDWCTDNFLAELVPFFENEAVQLAYARTVFMDGAGEEQTWSINEYLHDIDPRKWHSSFVDTAHKLVAEAFAIKNIIPNVSSAIFRNPRTLEILQDPEWRQMTTSGDWVLYLHIIRGGMLAYSPEATNYYRMHGKNISVGSHSQDKFYAEHEFVARTVRQYFAVDEAVYEKQRANLIAHWRETRPSFSDEAFDACYSLPRIIDSCRQRAPNLLIVSYAFCAGGGETFPIQLANIMKSSGYNVTYLDCAREPRNHGIRKNLRIDIPVVSDFTQLPRIVADFGIDLIHSHHAWADSTVLDLLPEDTPCKTVVTLHGMYETINDYDLKAILPRLVRRSSKLIYVAQKNLSSLRKFKLLEKAKLVKIDNALDPVAFEPVQRADLGIAADAFVFSLVSRGLVEKGWQEAIEAVTLARAKSGADIHLVLVGDGAEYERLQGEQREDFIHLEGFQRNVRGYFALADMGFLPSRFMGESFPLVIIECLQSGRPMLASKLGEISYMLDSPEGVAGELIELDKDTINIEALADTIVSIAMSRDRYRRYLSAVPAAAQKFDPGILATRHDAAYREAMAD